MRAPLCLLAALLLTAAQCAHGSIEYQTITWEDDTPIDDEWNAATDITVAADYYARPTRLDVWNYVLNYASSAGKEILKGTYQAATCETPESPSPSTTTTPMTTSSMPNGTAASNATSSAATTSSTPTSTTATSPSTTTPTTTTTTLTSTTSSASVGGGRPKPNEQNPFCPYGNNFPRNGDEYQFCRDVIGFDKKGVGGPTCCSAEMANSIQFVYDSVIKSVDDLPDDCPALLEQYLCWICAPFQETEKYRFLYVNSTFQQLCVNDYNNFFKTCSRVETATKVRSTNKDFIRPWQVLKQGALAEYCWSMSANQFISVSGAHSLVANTWACLVAFVAAVALLYV